MSYFQDLFNMSDKANAKPTLSSLLVTKEIVRFSNNGAKHVDFGALARLPEGKARLKRVLDGVRSTSSRTQTKI